MKTPILYFVLVLMGGLLLQKAAAQTFFPDTVYMHSGRAVFGKIIQSDSLEGITIINDCGIEKIQLQSIERIGQFVPEEKAPRPAYGFFNLSSAGLLAGYGDNGFVPIPSLTSINGIQFNDKFFIGLGVGFEYYNWSALPLFVSGTYVLRPNVFSPYTSLKLGYAFALEKYSRINYDGYDMRNYGGVLLSPEAGISIPIGETSNLLLGLGYHFQELSEEKPQWHSSNSNALPSRVYTNYNRISLRVGFLFR
jgi:hypothetical protein